MNRLGNFYNVTFSYSLCYYLVVLILFLIFVKTNKQNKSIMTITINQNDIVSLHKAARRQAAIESGSYGRFKNKVFKNKKAYSRKSKHKKTQL